MSTSFGAVRIRVGFVGTSAIAMATCFAASTPAVDRVWNDGKGKSRGDGISFADGNNWTPTGIPGPGDTAIFQFLGGTVEMPAGVTAVNRLRLAEGGTKVDFELKDSVFKLL